MGIFDKLLYSVFACCSAAFFGTWLSSFSAGGFLLLAFLAFAQWKNLEGGK